MKYVKYAVVSMITIFLLLTIPVFSKATEEGENETEKVEPPKVTAIQITSPETGTYNANQIVNICVYFDKKVTGTSVPTLKIKFGNGEVRSLTNGTIHNGAEIGTYDQYIEYSYNIQTGDNGYLTVSGLEGGTITDVDGNSAILSAPELTGSISIKAETVTASEEKTETKTETQTTSKQESTEKETTTNTDKTTAKKSLPYTGIGFGSILVIAIIVLIIGIVTKVKYNKLKDI